MTNASVVTRDPAAETGSSETVVLRVEAGALATCPNWVDHKRARNWLARIDRDPLMPGGLARRFAQHGKGKYFYVLNTELQFGAPIEFGADYVSSGGNRTYSRWYGVIIDRGPTALVVESYTTSSAALKRADELRPEAERRAAEAERAHQAELQAEAEAELARRAEADAAAERARQERLRARTPAGRKARQLAKLSAEIEVLERRLAIKRADLALVQAAPVDEPA